MSPYSPGPIDQLIRLLLFVHLLHSFRQDLGVLTIGVKLPAGALGRGGGEADAFGSNVTGLVTENSKRKWIGIDLVEGYLK